MKLNLACGTKTPDGWINVDYAMGARFSKIPVLRTLNKKLKFFNSVWDENIKIVNLAINFPWENNSIDVVYSSHTLEHFTKKEGLHFLTQCHRVLKPNGIIRVVVPDLKDIIARYTSGELRSDDLIERLGVLYWINPNQIKNKLAPFVQFPHKCMYDIETLITILTDIGFLVESRRLFDSDIEDVETVEMERPINKQAIVEGRKL